MNVSLTDYYKCPEESVRLARKEMISSPSGYFLFGKDCTCYGTYRQQQPSSVAGNELNDALGEVVIEDGTAYLPFNPSQVADNLRRELYADNKKNGDSVVSRMYYLLRPALSVGIRRHLQRLRLRGWDKLSFPRWPVDCSVENLFEQLMLLALRTSGEPIPFIWFWPTGISSCAIMTHDVETQNGRDYCPSLMDIDDSFGIKSSFQIIPEGRYSVTPAFLAAIQDRGFEVVVHDLNHDGHLYKSQEQFLERAARINAYGKQFGADGFRAGVLYRKQLWYDALRFSYDMSVPNVAHLDPQRGGCCTVMPYFVGDILEIPVTTIQDYTLFHILNDYSLDIWKQQTDIILAKHGCMSFIVHPDYIRGPREREVYQMLLEYLGHLRRDKEVWITTPGEVNRWWRQRANMKLVKKGQDWHIEGDGKERACVAYASEEDGRLVITM